jgi:hypothetical protein
MSTTETKGCSYCATPGHLLKCLPETVPMCIACHCWRIFGASPEEALGMSRADVIRLGQITDNKRLQTLRRAAQLGRARKRRSQRPSVLQGAGTYDPG